MFRIRVTLDPLQSNGSIPFSYNHVLAAAFYSKLTLHSTFEGRFAISNLQFESFEAVNGRIRPSSVTPVSFIASLMTNIDYKEIYEAVFDRVFPIGDNVSVARFVCSQVKKLPPVTIKPTMTYRSLSPICVRWRQDNGNDKYLLPGDHLFEDMFFDHLLQKFNKFANHRIDTSSCRFYEKGKLNTKLLSIVKDNRVLKIRGFLQQFSVTAPPEIQTTLIYAGAGSMNALGFGCVDAI